MIGLIYAAAILLKARNAKGDRYLNQMTRRVMFLDAPQTPDGVLAALTGGVTGHAATLEAADPARHRLVLTDKATMTTFGFFYPIHVTPSGRGSRVEIGIVSRGNQWGPLVTRAHETFLNAVRATLGLPDPQTSSPVP